MFVRPILFEKVTRLMCRASSTAAVNESCNSDRFTVFSGIQPTGQIHLGNYFGAITLWRSLLNRPQHRCVFSLVDMHSITAKQEPLMLRTQIYEQLACLIASGIDPSRCILFRQSDVDEHGQLAWILACQLTMTKLNTIPQFKEKTQHMKETPLGLYLYPVLQAADILLYRSNRVPVGDDQTAHIFLTQSLAKRFNHRFGQLFPVPEQLSAVAGARIKSLRDPTKKMSKSDPDPKSRISLLDTDDNILSKVKKAITDFDSKVSFDLDRRPAVSNLILLEHLLTDQSIDDIVQDSNSITTAQYKQRLAEVIIEHIGPIRNEARRLLDDRLHLDRTLQQGAEQARSIASQTLNQVKKLIGFY